MRQIRAALTRMLPRIEKRFAAFRFPSITKRETAGSLNDRRSVDRRSTARSFASRGKYATSFRVEKKKKKKFAATRSISDEVSAAPIYLWTAAPRRAIRDLSVRFARDPAPSADISKFIRYTAGSDERRWKLSAIYARFPRILIDHLPEPLRRSKSRR